MTRKRVDFSELHKASRNGLCFICEFLKRNPEYRHRLVAETDQAIAFLDRFPTMFGRVIVAPKMHLEQVTGDFTQEEYLELQAFIYKVSEAVRSVLKPERIYILSLGSQAANSHAHWHIAPLPSGVPPQEQQYHALMHENGAIQVSENELASLAEKLRERLN